MFHEPWWLDAVAPGVWAEAAVRQGGAVVARLPYIVKKSFGVSSISMPLLTHVLGPQLPAAGLPASDHRALIHELVAQLPRHDHFNQTCNPQFETALPFYALGYDVALTYTLRAEATRSPQWSWACMRAEMRRAIRKAEAKFTVHHDLGIEEFCRFFSANVKTRERHWWSKPDGGRLDGARRRLHAAATARDAGALLAARDAGGALRGAIMVVWGHGVMYYLMTAYDPGPAGNGAVKLLVWEAMKLASQKGLIFDFDGFPRPSAVNFLTGFGGEVRNRLVLSKSSPMLVLARAVKSRIR